MEYGDEKNLAPAQLEKIAQTLNLTLSIAHAKQADAKSRGDTFDIVDTPNLLMRYQDPDRVGASTKKAAVTEETQSWVPFTVGDRFSDKPLKGPTSKEVEDKLENTPGLSGWKKASCHEHFAPRINAEALSNMLTDANVRVNRNLTKLAAIAKSPSAYQEVIQDIYAFGKQAGAVIANALDARRSELHYATVKVAADTRDFFRDRHDILPILEELQEALYEKQACLELRAGENEKMASLDGLGFDPDNPGGTAVYDEEPRPGKQQAQEERELLRERQRKEDKAEREKQRQEDKEERINTSVQTAQGNAALARSQVRDLLGLAEERGQRPGTGYGGEPTGAAPDDIRQALLGAYQSGVGSIAPITGAVASGTRGLAETLGSASSTAHDQAKRTAEGYTALFGPGHTDQQSRLQNKLTAWRQGAVLQRLLMSDDVLSKMDPSQVASAFQTLRKNSPTQAQDINVVRMLLREALQYQGTPLDQVKTLRQVEGKIPEKIPA